MTEAVGCYCMVVGCYAFRRQCWLVGTVCIVLYVGDDGLILDSFLNSGR